MSDVPRWLLRKGSPIKRIVGPKSIPKIAVGVLLLICCSIPFCLQPNSTSEDTDQQIPSPSSQVEGGSSTQPQHQDDLKLLLASHGRLLWWYPSSQKVVVLHEGQGVHYGVFPGSYTADEGLATVWCVLRPHNWHPATSEELLLELNAHTGVEVSRRRLQARFTHDAVRYGEDVYVASTDTGEVLHLKFPDMQQVRRLPLFTHRQHVNSLAPVGKGAMWAMLHNLGQSSLVKVDLREGREPHVVGSIPQIGMKAHGCVAWRSWLLFLNSDRGALCKVDPASMQPLQQQQQQQDEHTLEEQQAKGAMGGAQVLFQVPDQGKFLKGLCVVGDVAYFGISAWAVRKARDDRGADSEVAAFHLTRGQLLWRAVVPTHGLLNVIAAPHLSEASTYRAVPLPGDPPDQEAQVQPEQLQQRTDQQVEQHGRQHTDLPEQPESDMQGPAAGSGAAASAVGRRLGAWAQDELVLQQQQQQRQVPSPGQSATAGSEQVLQDSKSVSSQSSLASAQAEGEVQGGRAEAEGLGSLHAGTEQAASLPATNTGSTLHSVTVSTRSSAPGVMAAGSTDTDQGSMGPTSPMLPAGRGTGQSTDPASHRDGVDSGSAGSSSSSDSSRQASSAAAGIQDAAVILLTEKLIRMGFPPAVGGHWPTGLPFLDLTIKQRVNSWEAGIQLPLTQVDVADLQAAVHALPDEMWSDDYQALHNAAVEGRNVNLAKFKPGVKSMYLAFSDRSVEHTYIYPFYDKFSHVIEPLLVQVLGREGLERVIRLQLALMPPGTSIHVHRDMGGYAVQAHRIHIPITTNSDVHFQVCPGLERRLQGQRLEVMDAHITQPDDCVDIPMAPGMVFELNNRVLHRVSNQSPSPRIQLVVDVTERARPQLKLQPGTQCVYQKGMVVCPEGTVTPL